ncbi:MAG: virulence factor SrfB [Hyphomicrobiaceae bacterium]
MITAALSSIAPEPSGAPDGQGRLFDRVCRLVPASGLQFIDSGLDAAHLAMLRAWFTEDEIETTSGVRRVLLPLASDAASDGTIWHPLTFKPLGPSETLSFSGLEALEPFLDTWVPVPFLRYLGRTGDAAQRYDQGPSNWARVFVAKPAEGLRGADRLQVVFAFDTRLDMRSRADQTPYLAPNSDDALFASTFMLADAPEELSDYLSQGWIDTWVRDICRAHTSSAAITDFDEAGFTTAPTPDAGFALAHIARYLTFLKILKRATTTPQIRFVDSISKTLPTAISGLDLVIDFGAAETTALLIPRSQTRDPDITMLARSAVPLRLRDLSNPVDIHSGPIPTLVEFDNQTFGNAALSRRSGRHDAFAWSSLVRIGVEAKRLALRSNATEGITGLADIASGLDQTSPSDVLWRFSTADSPTAKSGRMVTGEALRHLSESGDVTSRPDGLLAGPNGESASMAAMRPRFSQSALVGFFIVELLLHAISEINSATPGSPFAQQTSERNDIRHIERIIITSPVAMSSIERQNLVERVNTAIDLIWRTQQWDQPGQLAQPIKPQLALGIGADVGLQLVYLFTEVRNKFGGSFSDLVDCIRRRTGDPDARDSLRISSLELSRRAAGLTVIDYDVAHDGSVQAGLVLADRTGFGGDRVIDAIAHNHILAAIEAKLSSCGLDDAQDFMLDYLAGGDDPSGPNQNGKRFLTKILRPAATGVFDTYANTPARGAEGLRRYRLDHLVALGGGRLDPAAVHFEAAATAAGAINFHLGTISLDVGRRHIKRLVETELWPMVNAMTDAIQNSESDLLLMGGDLAQLPDLLDHVLSRGPVPAGRIVVRDSNTGTQPASQTAASSSTKPTRSTTHDTALLGAYMASRNMLVSEGFSLAAGNITQALSSEQRAQPSLALHAAARNAASNSSEPPAHDRAYSMAGGSFVREKTATVVYDDITPPPVKKSNGERTR